MFAASVTNNAHKTEFRDAAAEWSMLRISISPEGTGTGNYILVTDGGTGESGGTSIVAWPAARRR